MINSATRNEEEDASVNRKIRERAGRKDDDDDDDDDDEEKPEH